MVNINKKNLDEKLKNEAWTIFREAISKTVDTTEVLKKFFTPNELAMIENRLAILALLKRKRSYLSIRRELDVSSNTISFIKHGFAIQHRPKRACPSASGSRSRKKFPRYKGSRGFGLAEW